MWTETLYFKCFLLFIRLTPATGINRSLACHPVDREPIHIVRSVMHAACHNASKTTSGHDSSLLLLSAASDGFSRNFSYLLSRRHFQR